MEKQRNWFRTDVEFESSFKYWFALMWQNHYIQLFLIVLPIFILELINVNWIYGSIAEACYEGAVSGAMAVMGSFIAPVILGVIIYKGFYQYYQDQKKGLTR
jgi:hypothetical protein